MQAYSIPLPIPCDFRRIEVEKRPKLNLEVGEWRLTEL